MEENELRGGIVVRNPWIKWVLLGLKIIAMFAVVCLIIIGGPFLINECYKDNSRFTTVWNTTDILSYYGSIASALIGILGVYFTVYIANKNYREDAKSKILPYIAINVINI